MSLPVRESPSTLAPLIAFAATSERFTAPGAMSSDLTLFIPWRAIAEPENATNSATQLITKAGEGRWRTRNFTSRPPQAIGEDRDGRRRAGGVIGVISPPVGIALAAQRRQDNRLLRRAAAVDHLGPGRTLDKSAAGHPLVERNGSALNYVDRPEVRPAYSAVDDLARADLALPDPWVRVGVGHIAACR